VKISDRLPYRISTQCVEDLWVSWKRWPCEKLGSVVKLWLKIWISRCLSSWKSPAQLCKISEHCRLHEYDITFDGIQHDVRESTNKVETMVRQAQLIYCVFITGYMFRPIYGSSSGLLTRESVNAIHVGIPSCFTEIKYVKYIKCLC
jgi:hypothetical protein